MASSTVSKYLNDAKFQEVAFALVVKRIYEELRAAAAHKGTDG